MIIVRTVFGSKLYGTNHAGSDDDFKQIHKEPLSSFLNNTYRETITTTTNGVTKNGPGDIDFESKELRSFIIKGCLGGQTYAMDMLFTPKHCVLETSPIWEELISKRDLLITNNVTPFMDYCRGQAQKYSVKGDKLKEYQMVYDALQKADPHDTAEQIRDFIEKQTWYHVEIFKQEIGRKGEQKFEDYLRCGETKYPMTRNVVEITRSLKKKIDVYGGRARTAAESNGVDLKAYYHAMRLCWELEELLTNKEIVFPSKNVKTLLDIRNGVYDKAYIDAWIEDEIARVFTLPNNLPAPNYDYWNNWLFNTYKCPD